MFGPTPFHLRLGSRLHRRRKVSEYNMLLGSFVLHCAVHVVSQLLQNTEME